jgi:hypothetical protein
MEFFIEPLNAAVQFHFANILSSLGAFDNLTATSAFQIGFRNETGDGSIRMYCSVTTTRGYTLDESSKRFPLPFCSHL